MLAFNRDAGVVLAGDLGATHSRVAVTDLAGEVMAQDVHDIAVAEGPDVVLRWLEETFDRLLLEIGRASEDVRGVGRRFAGPGRVRRRPTREPSDHAGLESLSGRRTAG